LAFLRAKCAYSLTSLSKPPMRSFPSVAPSKV
jgi:hypothetical protein